MRNSHKSHTAPSSFFWNSDLSEDRKQQLINWIDSMSDEDRSMLNDLLDDVRQEESFYASETEDI